jgi:small-conductance mechanosensitive channel
LDYLIFLGAILLSVIVLMIIKRVILHRLQKWAQKTKTLIDDVLVRGIRKNLVPMLYFLAIYLCTQILEFGDTTQRVINIVALAFIMLFGTIFISSIIIYFFNRYWEKRNSKVDKNALKWIAALIKIVIWSAALLIFLDNVGVKITALITGLGIGGIAIAFAAQAVLEDIFSFVSIFFDKPFEMDDFIIVDDLMGTVEHIGVKTTRLRSLSGEQLIFSNKDLTSSRIKNYKRMKTRRIAFTLGVTYDTTLEQLRDIPGIIKSIIDGVENTTFDRAHFASYGDFSLNFEIVYYVLSEDYTVYMDTRQEINLLVKDAFDNRGIEFAFPTQTLIVQRGAANEEGLI